MMNQENIWMNMLNAQKTMMDSWQKMMPSTEDAKGSQNVFPDMSAMNNWMQMQQQLMTNWNQMMNNWNQMMEMSKTAMPFTENFEPLKAWQELTDAYNPLEFADMMPKQNLELYEKMMNSKQFYLAMHKFWDDIKTYYIDPGAEQTEKLSKELKEQYDKILKENLLPIMPPELRTFVQTPHELIQVIMETFGRFAEPWKNSMDDMINALAQGAIKDPAKFNDFIKIWKENYDKTVGELIKSPVMGSNRELIEQQNKAVDKMIDLIMVFSEASFAVTNIASTQSDDAVNAYIELVKKGEQPKSFQEFYDYWSGQLEGELEKYFYTDEYAALLAKLSDAFMDYKIESDKLLEKQLETTPIVTDAKIDSVYKTIYLLKKEVKTLKKKVESLEAGQAKPAKKA
jgi:class III poly(R)-hydroxyalkanoic acid synthase PhaE subunit